MPSPAQTSRFAVVVDFLERLTEDRARGAVKTLADYQGLYPGYESEIAREHAQVLGPDSSTTGPADRDAGPDRRIRYGKFETLRELGHGGQGVVYLARHTRLDKDVALKVLAQGRMGESDKLRFEREARLAAQIDHPGLCPVFDFGFEQGDAYIAMQFVPGITLDKQLDNRRRAAGPVPPDSGRARIREALGLVEEVARAVHVAHETGIMHRDLKPSNIMVRPDGAPVVLDFGIARSLERDDDRRPAEAMFGTPPYMAPEQFSPDAIPPDRRVDVFALGAVLYELVTLRRAFEGPLLRDSDGIPIRDTPEDPRRLVQHVDRDLSVVIRTALASDRSDRYLTALDLAEDLRALQDARPIRAIPPSLAHRCHRWMQRNPRLSASIAALFVTLVTGLVVSLILAGRARTAELNALWENYQTRIRAAKLSLDGGDAAAARDQLRACLPELRGLEWDRLWIRTNSSEASLSLGGPVQGLVSLPDAPTRFVALVDGAAKHVDLRELTASESGWGEGLRKIRRLGGRRFLVELLGADRHHLQVRDPGFAPVGSPTLLRGPTSALAASDDGTKIAYSDVPGEIRILANGDSEPLRWSTPSGDTVTGLRFSPGGERLAAGFAVDSRHPVIVFDAYDLFPRTWIRESRTDLRALAFSADGLRLVIATSDLEVRGTDVVSILDLVPEQGSHLARFEGSIGSVTALLTHPQGDVFVGTEDGEIHWLSSDLRSRLGVFLGHADAITSILLDPTGQWLLTSSADGSVRTWSARRPSGSYTLEAPTDRARWNPGIASLTFSAAGDKLLAGGPSGFIDLWDLDGAEALRRIPTGDATTVGFGPGDSSLAYTGFSDSDVIRVVGLDGAPPAPLLPPERTRGSGPTLIDGARRRVVFARDPHPWVRIMSFDGVEERDLEGLSTTPWSLATSYDGERVAALTDEGFRVWDLATGQDLPVPWTVRRPNPMYAQVLALDRDGGKLAFAGGNDTVLLFDLARPDDEPVTLDHLAPVTAVAFSPVDDRLATVSDRQVHLWDYIRGANLLSMAGMTYPAFTLAFSDQGDRLAVGSGDGRIHVWELRERDPPRRFGSGLPPVAPPYQQPSLSERLRLAHDAGSSMVILDLRPDEILGRPFLPRAWYEIARDALPGGQAMERFQSFLYDGLEQLRSGKDLQMAEQQLRLAAEQSLADHGMVGHVILSPLVSCQILLGDRARALDSVQRHGPLANNEAYWETQMLLEAPNASNAYRLAQELTLEAHTLEVAIERLAIRESSVDRDLALRFLDRVEELPSLYHVFAWLFATTPGLGEERYEKAVGWARRAIELQPTTRHRLTLAAALYRAGRESEAIEELAGISPGRNSEELIHAALRCLCRFSLGQDGGWEAYNEFVVLARSPRFRNDREVTDLAAEVRRVRLVQPGPPWK